MKDVILELQLMKVFNNKNNVSLYYNLKKEWVGGLWYLHHFQQYFSFITVVSFIGGGNRSIQRKSQIYRKSQTNFIT